MLLPQDIWPPYASQSIVIDIRQFYGHLGTTGAIVDHVLVRILPQSNIFTQ